jgi:protein N-lysine methyltransferase METTL21D
VTYNTSSFPALLRTLITLLTPPTPTSPLPLLLLAYKQRDESERELWTMLRKGGVEMGLVDVVRGAEGEDGDGKVEIWVGGMSRSMI